MSTEGSFEKVNKIKIKKKEQWSSNFYQYKIANIFSSCKNDNIRSLSRLML
jgi:hypothetical protein